MFFTIILFAIVAKGQFLCDKVRLYDQMIVKGDQPMLHKLNPFDIRLIPDTTLLNMKKEIINVTSSEFFSGLKLKSVKLFDSANARAWSWTNKPIFDKNSNPVYFFYAVLFETNTTNGLPFIFRLDVLKNGELLNKEQIAIFKKERLDIIGCKKVVSLILADKIQPIDSIEDMALAYSPKYKTVIWTVASVPNPKTGIEVYKEINAITGEIISRSIFDLNKPPEIIKIENSRF